MLITISLIYIFGDKIKARIICYARTRASSCSFQKVKGEQTKNTSKPCAFGNVTDRKFILNKNNFCFIMLDLTTSGSTSTYIDDVRSDYNILKPDVNIFVESKLCLSDRDDAYQLCKFTSYRNYFSQSNTSLALELLCSFFLY